MHMCSLFIKVANAYLICIGVLKLENIYSFYEISKNLSIEVFLELRGKVASWKNKESQQRRERNIVQYIAECKCICMRRKI